MNALNQELKETAVGYGLCKHWQGMWSHYFYSDELIDMFIKGQDFCIEHDYPSLDFIRRNFSATDLQSNGVYVDAEIDSVLPSGTYVVMGESHGTMRFGRWTAAVVYLRHYSEIRLVADEMSKVQIRLYDNATVETEAAETARVKTYDRR